MLLNVGGAGLIDLFRESSLLGPELAEAVKSKGLVEGTPELDAFLDAGRWALDEVDPINLARFALREPARYSDPITRSPALAAPKRLRLQMAINDPVVPNAATFRLVDATGIDPSTSFRSFVGSHVFLANPIEPSCSAGQADMAAFLEAGL